ncbi:hypothetical protein BV20DRAFT_206182 [Pilatotrama ljubarskyi]|nr:hypothetical protein BV20DRAFT_206182 [Pilatotrama ljubarskyi]
MHSPFLSGKSRSALSKSGWTVCTSSCVVPRHVCSGLSVWPLPPPTCPTAFPLFGPLPNIGRGKSPFPFLDVMFISPRRYTSRLDHHHLPSLWLSLLPLRLPLPRWHGAWFVMPAL